MKNLRRGKMGLHRIAMRRSKVDLDIVLIFFTNEHQGLVEDLDPGQFLVEKSSQRLTLGVSRVLEHSIGRNIKLQEERHLN